MGYSVKSDTLERINRVSAERQELFKLAADGFLSADERQRMKTLSDELTRLWDQYRREGHPPAVEPVRDEWDRPRRGRRAATSIVHHVAWPTGSNQAA